MKNTVCLLLEFGPPGINPLLMIEMQIQKHIRCGKYMLLDSNPL